MGPNLIALAVPFFFLLIVVELVVARRRGVKIYRFADAFADMSCGMSQQLTQLLYAAALVVVHQEVFQRWTLVRFAENSVWPWVIAFVGVEFIYYWWHRLSHEVNFLWAGHVVHHQSEDYNLAVALRQSVLTYLTIWPMYLTLAFVGVPAVQMSVVVAISTLYQFWIHTELVGKLGVFEKWLNTPALHRVHHAINPRYIDKNYGAIVIVFDRIFRTYEPETEKPVYGLVGPLRSFNPLWAQFATLTSLVKRTRLAPRWGDKLRVWFKGPEWHIPGVETPKLPQPVTPETFVKYDVAPPRTVSIYVFVQFVLLTTATFLLMLFGKSLPWLNLAVGVAMALGSMPVLSGLLEGKRWAPTAEFARLAVVLTGAAAAFVAGAAAWWSLGGVVLAAASTLWFRSVRGAAVVPAAVAEAHAVPVEK